MEQIAENASSRAPLTAQAAWAEIKARLMAHGIGGSTMELSPRAVLLGRNTYSLEFEEQVEGDEMPGEILVSIAPRRSNEARPQVPLTDAPLTAAGVERIVSAVLDAEAATAEHAAEAMGGA